MQQDTTLPLEAEKTDTPEKAPETAQGEPEKGDGTNAAGEAGKGPDDAAAQPLPAEKAPIRLEATSDGVRSIIPQDLEQVGKLAQGIIASGIVPEAFKYSENVRDGDDQIVHHKGDPNRPLIIMGILKSLEIGLPPLTGLSYLLPINDRFTIWGDGAVALAQAKGLIVNQTKAAIGPALEPGTELAEYPDEYGVEVRYWRKGQEQPYIGRYTVGDARRAKLWLNPNKGPWLKHPDRMLFNRARAFALRDGFADALSGLAIAEEVRDYAEPVDGGELQPKKSLSAQVDEED